MGVGGYECMNSIFIYDPHLPTHSVFVIKDYLSVSCSYIFLEVFSRESVIASNCHKPINLELGEFNSTFTVKALSNDM